jgi:ParB-like chromosome segregation protein Spo0J
MKTEQWPIENVIPYDKNPRHNEESIKHVAESIKQFGFRQPIVIDKTGVIIAGHTRHKAAQLLKLKTVPVHVATDMTAKQIRAYRIADNSAGEKSTWDKNLLEAEIAELSDFDFSMFGIEAEAETLADKINAETPWTETYDEADKTEEKLTEKIKKLKEKGHLNAGKPIILSANSGSFILVDNHLDDFIAEIKRYSEAGEPSPLSKILEMVHPLK